jgi:hypothetical protein
VNWGGRSDSPQGLQRLAERGLVMAALRATDQVPFDLASIIAAEVVTDQKR